MIYVFSFSDIDIRGVRPIKLTKESARREISKAIKTMDDYDMGVLLPIGDPPKDLEKIIKKYKNTFPIMSFSEDDVGKKFDLVDRHKFQPSDIVIFIKRDMQMSGISSNVKYDKIRKKIIRLCGDGDLYAPHDRKDIPKPIEYPRALPFAEPDRVEEKNVGGKKENMAVEQMKYKPYAEYKVTVNLGIGDILLARGTLDAQKENFYKCFISPGYKTIKRVRHSSESDLAFAKELLQMVFQPPYYVLEDEEKDYPTRYAPLFTQLDKIPVVPPNLADVLCEGKKLNIGPYVTVSTRVRNIPITEYDKDIKKQFIECLQNISKKYKIFVLGERKFIDYPEHDVIKDRLICIYDDVIKSLPKNKVIDLTYEDINHITNKMPFFKQTCMYMRNADWNIILGNGGDGCVAMSVGNTVGYYTATNPSDDFSFIFNNKTYYGIHYNNSLPKFFDKLNDIAVIDKPVYKACINMGIGDMMIIRGELDRAKDRWSKVLISPNIPWFKKDVRDEKWTDGYIMDIMRMTFPKPWYEITNDYSYPPRDGNGLQIFDGMPCAAPQQLDDVFCKGEPLDIDEPYVTLNTKVRIVQHTSYLQWRPKLYETLNEVAKKYKIVIMGDRALPDWNEFKMNPKDIFVIYDDIMKNLPHDRLIDRTFGTMTQNSIKNFQQDCVIMKNAVNNIMVGAGGCWCFGLAVGKSISYYEPRQEVLHWIDYKSIKSNAILTEDFERYLYWLKQL